MSLSHARQPMRVTALMASSGAELIMKRRRPCQEAQKKYCAAHLAGSAPLCTPVQVRCSAAIRACSLSFSESLLSHRFQSLDHGPLEEHEVVGHLHGVDIALHRPRECLLVQRDVADV